MKWSLKILIVVFSLVIVRCSKDNSSPITPPVNKVVKISNLVYAPHIIPIKFYSPTYTINGTVDFTDADGGVAKIRLTTSAGSDTTINITGGAGVTSGTINGIFEFGRPVIPQNYSFQIWVIDLKGNASNKLGGTVEVIFDDRGETWWPVMGSNYVMNKVAWLNNQYIAVGTGGRIETSKNGASWTTQNTSSLNVGSLNGVTWTGSEYYAVGERNSLAASPDGITWSLRSIGAPTDGYLKSVASSGTLLVAVGSAYSYASDFPEILASTDGIHWSENLFSFPVFGGLLRSVIWSGTQFVAVGQGRDGDHDFLLIVTSPDGITWTDRSIHSPWVSLYDITWTGSQFVAAGASIIVISADGTSWEVKQINTLKKVRSIIYTGKRYAVCGDGGVFISDDGINWHQTYPEGIPDIDYLKSIAWSSTNYNYVATGLYFTPYLVSP